MNNPDRNNQAQEVTFSLELKKVPQPPLIFNNTDVFLSKPQKHRRYSIKFQTSLRKTL